MCIVNLESTSSLSGEFTVDIIREDEVVATAKATNALTATGNAVARKGIFASVSGSLPYIGCARVYYRQLGVNNNSGKVIAKSWSGWNQARRMEGGGYLQNITTGSYGSRQVSYEFNWSGGFTLGYGHAGVVGTWDGYPSHVYKGFWWPPGEEYNSVPIGNSSNYFSIQLAKYYSAYGGYAGTDLLNSGNITQFLAMNSRPLGGDQQEDPAWPAAVLNSINGNKDSMKITYKLICSGASFPWDWTQAAMDGMLQEFIGGNSPVKSNGSYVTIEAPTGSPAHVYGSTGAAVGWSGYPNYVTSGHTGVTGVITTPDTVTPIFKLYNSNSPPVVLATKVSSYPINYYNGSRVSINWTINMPN